MISVRHATETDAAAVSDLLQQLGYSMSSRQVADKIALFSQTVTDAVFVAVDSGSVCGCASAHVAELFHAPGRIGRITAMVVAATARRKGIGRLLHKVVTQFFIDCGCVKVEVTSGVNRVDAHVFYEKLGFTEYRRRYVREIAT